MYGYIWLNKFMYLTITKMSYISSRRINFQNSTKSDLENRVNKSIEDLTKIQPFMPTQDFDFKTKEIQQNISEERFIEMIQYFKEKITEGYVPSCAIKNLQICASC